MAAATPKKTSNFKTYEAQARLLTALIASHDFRIDYKKIAEFYGNGATASAIEHRFRPLRAGAERLRIAVRDGKDPSGVNIFDGTKGTPKELAKAYGESTPDGLQFQFRSIKANAEKIKGALERGEDPKTAFDPYTAARTSSAAATPSGTAAAARKRKTATPATPKTPKTSVPRRNKTKTNYAEQIDSDEDSPEQDYEALDLSPLQNTKRARVNQGLGTNSSPYTPAEETAMIKQEAAAIKAAKLRDIPATKKEKSPTLTTAPAQNMTFMTPVTTINYSTSFTSPTTMASFSSPTTSGAFNSPAFGMSSFTSAAPSFGSFTSATTQPGSSASVSSGLTSADSSFARTSASFSSPGYGSYYSPSLLNVSHATTTMASPRVSAPLAFTPFAPVSVPASASAPPMSVNDTYSMSATNHGHSQFEADMGLADYESDDGI